MNKSKATNLCSCALLAGALVFCTSAARAEYRCDAPKSHFDRIACEKAKQSPTALRQFIHRIRTLENLYYNDYINPSTESAIAAKGGAPGGRTKLAQARR